jgi:signal transduction histidine kinase
MAIAHLARPRLSPRAQDALLAVAIAVFQVRGLMLVRPQDVHRLAEPLGLGYLLPAASGLALIARRSHPMVVAVAVAGMNLAYYAAGYPDGPVSIALFIALYSLTAYGDGRRSVLLAATCKLVLAPVWLLTTPVFPLRDAGWLFSRIIAAMMAAALGESVRARKVLAAEARERAENAERAKEEEARRRVDAERLRIAREVHDTVAHAIAVINIQAGVTAHILERRPGQAREMLGTIEATSARALHELRVTLGMLRDVTDDPRSPTPGLGQLKELAEGAGDAGLDVHLDVPCPLPELPSAVDHAAYRILQESLTNAIRHAGPTRVCIQVACDDEQVRIQVSDDGRAARRPVDGRPGPGGRGLLGMRERAALLGGTLSAGPRREGGFEVRAELPLVPSEAS